MQFTEAKLGRIYVIRLHDGDCLHKVLEQFAAENSVSAALCFFVGGAEGKSRVVVGPKDGCSLPPEPMITLLKGVHEACGVGTIIADEEGKPKLHMHAALGRAEKTITGCIRMGIKIWEIGEVIILEIKGIKANRRKDERTGFDLLKIE